MDKTDALTEYDTDDLHKALDLITDAIDEKRDPVDAVRRALALITGYGPDADIEYAALDLLTDLLRHLNALRAQPSVDETPEDATLRLLKAAEKAAATSPERARVFIDIALAHQERKS